MNARKLEPVGIAGAVLLLAVAGFYALRKPGTVPAEPGAPGAIPTGQPDVLLVTIDTLRADALGFAGNRRVETPVLDRLAAGGLVFSSAHAHNVVTLPSHANILTGLYPYQHGIRDNSGFRLDEKIPTLATLLKAKGYATGAFVGAFPLDSRFGLHRGFDVYDDRYPKADSGLDFEMAERPASQVVAAARAWYEAQRDVPRFLWVHVFDPHAPYHPPPDLAARYRDDPYLGEVAGTDAALEPLLGPFLSGTAPRALVVVTADHGEGLGDHGEETHGVFAYEATLRVPLVLWFPGAVRPGVEGDSVRHVDIAPTILAAAGIEKPPAMPGSSLLPGHRTGPAKASYFEAFSAAYNRGWAPLRGVVAERHKFIDLPLPELYDLGSDPGETRNRVSERGDVLRRLRLAIPRESDPGAVARGEPSGEEVTRLRSLGYLSGSSPIRKAYGAEDDPKNLVSVDRDIHRSIDLYQRGDLRGAITVARRLVEKRPTMPLAYESLAFLLRKGNDAKGALAVYRSALARGIATETLRTSFALALSESGRPEDAVRLLQPSSESADPETLNALGVALADAGRPAEALAAFQRALKVDPENAEAIENMGIVRLRADDPSAASDLFRRALALDSHLPRAWNGLGVAQARQGRETEAMESWRKAVALDPELYDALFNLGLVAGKNGFVAEAREALTRFVATAPPARYAPDIQKARGLLASLPGTRS